MSISYVLGTQRKPVFFSGIWPGFSIVDLGPGSRSCQTPFLCDVKKGGDLICPGAIAPFSCLMQSPRFNNETN